MRFGFRGEGFRWQSLLFSLCVYIGMQVRSQESGKAKEGPCYPVAIHPTYFITTTLTP